MQDHVDEREIESALTLPEGHECVTLAEFARLPFSAPEIRHVTGVAGCGPALLAWELATDGEQVLVVVRDSTAVEAMLADLEFIRSQLHPHAPTVAAVHVEHADPHASVQPERRTTMTRLAALSRLARDSVPVVVVNAAALIRRLPPRDAVRRATIRIDVDQDLDVTKLAERLSGAGYLRVPIVEDPGSFAVRGGLIDVWGADAVSPVRIELLGDAVMEIKTFSPDSQRTVDVVKVAFFPPAREAVVGIAPDADVRARLRELCDACNYPSVKARQLIEDVSSGRQTIGATGFLPAFYDLVGVWEHLDPSVQVLIHDPVGVVERFHEIHDAWEQGENTRVGEPHFPLSALAAEREALSIELGRRRVTVAASTFVRGKADADLLARLQGPIGEVPSLAQRDHSDLKRAVAATKASRGKAVALEPLLRRLLSWRDHGLAVTAVARSHSQAARLASLLSHRGVEVRGLSDSADPSGGDQAFGPSLAAPGSEVVITVGQLAHGVIAPLEQKVWLTEEEVFGQRRHADAKRTRSAAQNALQDLRALKEGDFVVHVEHGVGRYVGLENRPAPGGRQLELLVVEYTGGKLFLPVYRLNQIQKFSGGDKPKLDRLGGQSFAKTKARARKKAREMADELLRLYAERNNVEKSPLAPADDEYAAFEAAFPYEETRDQAAAIADVSADLENARVMDRLVCGDVGFGKTEVALRAAFRVAGAGRQVAVLCPTTVLAQQHYLTFSRRLQEQPFVVGVLSRFQNKKDSAATLEGIRKGTVDIIVGTHRLLSKDVEFKSLGLLVVDEEQRFGVTHKERIKQLRTSVDVLTLTATPIPRTLQQAIGGLREMSVISTPPIDRRAIRTMVAQFDEGVVREAVSRELSRGGQVFYVYNRVEGLYERAQRLQHLMPEVRVAVAHGQLKEAMLERVMLDFVDGRYDVLVATSIVESGLDIPRANTMIVDRADLFGLSQLYQLRGRVGRSVERAYCYLLVPALSEMSEEARSRIEAMERYSELGSGFQVATLDMELRGAGDLLGAEQSGTVQSVGLELFCRMLEEATAELRGEEVVHDIEPDMSFDVEALLPDDYIDEVGIRLSMYKRLASAVSDAEVLQLAVEMEDRFGHPPVPAQQLVELMRLKAELRRLKVTVCEGTGKGVSMRLRDDTPVDAAELMRFVAKRPGKYRLTPDGKLTRRADTSETRLGSLEQAARFVEELATLAELRPVAAR